MPEGSVSCTTKSGGLARLSWEPWEGSQTLPRRFAAGKAGRLRTRLLARTAYHAGAAREQCGLAHQLAAPARGRNPAYEAATRAQGAKRDRQQREIAGIRGVDPPENPAIRRCANVILCRLVPSSTDFVLWQGSEPIEVNPSCGGGIVGGPDFSAAILGGMGISCGGRSRHRSHRSRSRVFAGPALGPRAVEPGVAADDAAAENSGVTSTRGLGGGLAAERHTVGRTGLGVGGGFGRWWSAIPCAPGGRWQRCDSAGGRRI